MTSSTVLKTTAEREQPHLVTDLSRKTLSVSSLSIVLAVGVFFVVVHYLEEVPL